MSISPRGFDSHCLFRCEVAYGASAHLVQSLLATSDSKGNKYAGTRRYFS
jgi:hypothetical protein